LLGREDGLGKLDAVPGALDEILKDGQETRVGVVAVRDNVRATEKKVVVDGDHTKHAVWINFVDDLAGGQRLLGSVTRKMLGVGPCDPGQSLFRVDAIAVTRRAVAGQTEVRGSETLDGLIHQFPDASRHLNQAQRSGGLFADVDVHAVEVTVISDRHNTRNTIAMRL
jgi:hypothetical protein